MNTISRTEWLKLSDMGKNSTTVKLQWNPYLFIVSISETMYNVAKKTHDELVEELNIDMVHNHIVSYGYKSNRSDLAKELLFK